MAQNLTCGLCVHKTSKRCPRRGPHQCTGRTRSRGLGLRPVEGTRAGQLLCGLGLGDAFRFPKKDLASAVRFAVISSTRGVYSSKGMQRSRSSPSRPSCQGSKWSCLLLRIVLQDALSEVTKIYPPLKLRVFVDDITASVKGRNIKSWRKWKK